jgi:hypothetical protein
MQFAWIRLCLLVVFLASCRGGEPTSALPETVATTQVTVSPPANQSPTTTPLPTQAPTATSVEPSEPAELPLPLYEMEVDFYYSLHTVVVKQHVTYTNRAGESLPELLIVVETMNYPSVFQMKSFTWGDGTPIQSYVWEGSWLRVTLPAPLQPGQSIQLAMGYELNLPSPVQSSTTRPVPFGYSARQTNLVDWYPMIAPYKVGVGWLAHPPSYYGEHLVYESADYEITLRILDESAGIIIAASSPDLGDATSHRYQMNAARSFAFSFSPEYEVLTRQAGNVIISSYYYPFHAAAGEKALQVTAEAVELFSRLFGDYARPSLTVVEADFLDGMEYDGMYFLSNGFYNLYQGTPGEYLVAIAAHETAHQWWFGRVGNDQALEPWLDEALCTYSELIYYEALYPEAVQWWWSYRVDYYAPSGRINITIYNPDGSTTPYMAYKNSVYLNGAHFFDDLRKQIGDAVFFEFLKDYSKQMLHHITTSKLFFEILSQHSTNDFSALVDTYFK